MKCLLKLIIEGNIKGQMRREYEEEDVNSSWVILGKGEDNVN
jgi:hypothetical protein